MREILFRGRTDDGEWVQGYLVKHPATVSIGESNPWYIHVAPIDPDDNGGVFNVNPDTVGLYTGLRDKRGKRIFEGDIIEGIGSGAKADCFQIRWSSEVCGFTAGEGKRVWPNLNQITVSSYSVVGNIYDRKPEDSL